MGKNWAEHSNQYLQLFADCLAVKGAARSAFCDLTRHEIITFPSEYHPVLETLLGDRLGVVLNRIAVDPNREAILRFLDFLDDNELVMLVDDKSAFPPISEEWDFPGEVQNAIIDVSGVLHDFQQIFRDLNSLGCQHVQIRCFSNLMTLATSDPILEQAQHGSIVSIDLILKYEEEMPDEAYVSFVEERPMIVAMTIHSAPRTRRVAVDYGLWEVRDSAPMREVRFTSREIGSAIHCGIITQQYLCAPCVSTFFEAKAFNGCLNRKISIDVEGQIKNCPSMARSYGQGRERSLPGALRSAGFKDLWDIAKDRIAVCCDCEFRYVCSDCRAYLEEPENVLSKPLKCGYDPYTATWKQWSQDPRKARAVAFYGMEGLLRSEDDGAGRGGNG